MKRPYFSSWAFTVCQQPGCSGQGQDFRSGRCGRALPPSRVRWRCLEPLWARGKTHGSRQTWACWSLSIPLGKIPSPSLRRLSPGSCTSLRPQFPNFLSLLHFCGSQPACTVELARSGCTADKLDRTRWGGTRHERFSSFPAQKNHHQDLWCTLQRLGGEWGRGPARIVCLLGRWPVALGFFGLPWGWGQLLLSEDSAPCLVSPPLLLPARHLQSLRLWGSLEWLVHSLGQVLHWFGRRKFAHRAPGCCESWLTGSDPAALSLDVSSCLLGLCPLGRGSRTPHLHTLNPKVSWARGCGFFFFKKGRLKNKNGSEVLPPGYLCLYFKNGIDNTCIEGKSYGRVQKSSWAISWVSSYAQVSLELCGLLWLWGELGCGGGWWAQQKTGRTLVRECGGHRGNLTWNPVTRSGSQPKKSGWGAPFPIPADPGSPRLVKSYWGCFRKNGYTCAPVYTYPWKTA